MVRSRGSSRFASGGASAALLATAAAMWIGEASAQESCVQMSNTSFVPTCPCDAGSALTFSIEGQTTVAANTVNVAIVLDGSGSIGATDFDLSKSFAKDTVVAFADQNLFDNGGTASFTQFSFAANAGGTFSSQEDFDAYVDDELQIGSGTVISAGIARGRELLTAAPNTSTSFMIVLTDGNGGDPTAQADAARAEGTIVYAVGVGSGPDETTLLAIAGDESNIFDVDNFSELGTALEGIISSSAGSIPCAATGAVVSLEFNAAVVDAAVSDALGTAVIGEDGSSVIFEVSGTLEATPTAFSVVLEFCNEAPGTEIVSSVAYADDEGNDPDLSALEGDWSTVPACDSEVTPAPVTPTVVPVGVPLPTPVPMSDFSYEFSYDYSYDYSSSTDPWFEDDDNTFSYPSAPGPSPAIQTPSPVMQPVGPAPHHIPFTIQPFGLPFTLPPVRTTCDNGFYGVQSGAVCCDAGCGACGGVGCSGRPGGADACCVTEIRYDGEACSIAGAAPCYIDDATSPSPSSADDDDDDDDGDDSSSYSYSYDLDPSWWEGDDDGVMGWCSNGIPGIESPKGDVCCSVGCGQCGGVGCSTVAAPALDSYDCCITEILTYGESCAATEEAPCYLDG